MHDGTQRTDQPEGSGGDFSASALESAASYVGRSTGASRACNERRSQFAVAFEALLEWGASRALILPEDRFPFFRRPPDGHGNEHEAWFDENTNLWFKATYANRFGLAWGEDGSADPGAYLTRLILQNKYFADRIELVALVESHEKLRVLTSQPHIAGEPASADEIRDWFLRLGFARVEADSRIAWYNREANLLIADAHEGNVIRSTRKVGIRTKRVLVPIDLNIVQPAGDLLNWAILASEE